MRIRFWGTRGSIPKPGPDTVRYGGNTSCVEVRTAGGTLLLLDCGTGAHGFGQALLAEPDAPRRGHILIGHTHWDHIQGLPFLAPLFVPGYEWDIYGPRGLGPSLREALAGQMQYTYFPITVEQFQAAVRYHDLVEGTLTIGDVRVTAQYMNHPALTLGYRLEADGACVVYATDHEPHAVALAQGERGPQAEDERRYAAFVAGADLLIHDAQFTREDYPRHVGWGHSPMEFAIDTAAAGGVRRLALFHHDPLRDDDAVDRIVAAARQRAEGSGVEVFGAAEGRVVELAATPAPPREPCASTATAEPALATDRRVVLAAEGPAGDVLAAAIVADEAPLLRVHDLTALQSAWARADIGLIVVARHFGGADVLPLLSNPAPAHPQRERPPVIVVSQPGDEAEDAHDVPGAEAVTDWLQWPFKQSYARTRIHCALLRQGCRWQSAPRPRNESERLEALRGLSLLDTPAEERFDRYTRIAAGLFDVPIALVSLVDEDRQWFKARYGLGNLAETPREESFCAHAILEDGVMQVSDALADDRFADNPHVTGGPRLRFYAGAPLAAPDGSRVGTLCLIDRRARHFDEHQLGLLKDLAHLVSGELRNLAAKP